MNDPIVDEVRRIRDEHAARFNYDVEAIFRDIKERERKGGLVFVDGVARQPMTNPEPQSPPQLPQGSAAIPTLLGAGSGT